MDKNDIKNKIKSKMGETPIITETAIEESAVGFPGRTAKHEADTFVSENEDLVSEFKSLVKQIGGKAVACQLLERMKMGHGGVGLSEEAIMKPEDALRFKKNLHMPQEDFDEFIELGLVDVFPRKQGNETRVDIYTKGKPIVRGYYYPDQQNLVADDALHSMAFRSMTI